MALQNSGNTVFLTEQEANRIRITVQNRSKKCSDLQGTTRESRDFKTAKSQATGASLMADMGGAREDTLPALAVGQPYLPCTSSLEDLEPMALADLKLETHHRGRRMTVKRTCPVVVLAGTSWTMVQDDASETERLEIVLHKTRFGQDVLESAKQFVIKEPYFTVTDQDEPTIRIDHPSDLVVSMEDLTKSGLNLNFEVNGNADDSAAAEAMAKKCKEKGNKALKSQELQLAHAHYSEGLKIARQEIVVKSNPDLGRDISRNRAHVNLLLQQFDEAKADAEAALIGNQDTRSKELDSKAYFRAASAAYNLANYQDAKGYIGKQLELSPEDKEAKAWLRRIESRLREQDTGKYALKKTRATLSKARPRADAASFFTNTEVKDSPGRGRGLFATRDISAGQIVMVEKAFCVVWGFESEALTAMTYDVRDDQIRASAVGLAKATVQKLLNNPSQTEGVMDLYGDYEGLGKKALTINEGVMVDSFQVYDIISRNAFGPGNQYGEEGARNASTGLWIWAAYINHSCVPNAKKEYVGDLMVLRATKPIAEGEEIFHSYNESSDYEARQDAFKTTWGFECECALCVVEGAEDAAVRKKRREFVRHAEEFVAKEPWANAKKLSISRAQRLKRSIQDTYDGEKYKNLPLVGIQRIEEWLALANRRQ
ncbi:SET domain-containing protein [Microthyrium microscopicum]|uniref:SET domain-containing protein n=1 Tax=Microthyrium microscopicum TaxID=703497 RepID=A0A6A6U6I7_9PEZI|nr:SET domain-containing protein [Microthyrium microscopicum]